MLRLIIAICFLVPFAGPALAINGISEERFKLLMDALDKAFTAGGMLTNKERAYALGIDAPYYSRVMSGEANLPFHRVFAVQNVKFLIALCSELLFGLVRLTATELAEDFRRRA